MLIFFLFIFGLIIGSFLNVVILRGEAGEGLGGRSHCPQCKVKICWYDNIPLFSFLFLRGKCRHCQKKISWQYPLVEFCTGGIFTLLGGLFLGSLGIHALSDIIFFETTGLTYTVLLLGLFLILAAVLIAIVVSDIRTMTIPLSWLFVAVVLAFGIVLARFFAPNTLDILPSWQSMLWGGGIAGILFFALVFFSHETWMGMGDVWVAIVLGLTIGAHLLLFALTLSFLLGALVGLVLLGLEKKGLKSQIPFAPFLVGAIFIVWQIEWIHPAWIEYFLLPPISFFAL